MSGIKSEIKSEIKICKVVGIRELKQFAELPYKLYNPSSKVFAPQPVLERMLHFSRFNPYFEHAKACYFMAYKDGKVVGRISAQTCKLFHRYYDSDRGHFGFIDAIDDSLVFEALLCAAMAWLRGEGMKSMEGPYSFGINDECGVLVDGQENPQCLLYPYHPAYVHKHLEALGLKKLKDLKDFDFLPETNYRSEKFKKFLNIIDRYITRGIGGKKTIVKLLPRSEFDYYLGKVTDFYNETWKNNWRALPISTGEAKRFKKMIKLIKNQCFLISVEQVRENEGNDIIGFMLITPSLNDWFRDLRGRLFPFGFFILLYRLFFSRPSYYRGLIAGVKSKYHKTPMSGVIFGAMLKHLYFSDEIQNHPGNPNLLDKAVFNAGWVLEDNVGMLGIIDYFNGQQRHLYRIYEKELF